MGVNLCPTYLVAPNGKLVWANITKKSLKLCAVNKYEPLHDRYICTSSAAGATVPPGAARCRPVPGVPGVPPGAARCRPVPPGAARCPPVPPDATLVVIVTVVAKCAVEETFSTVLYFLHKVGLRGLS